MRTCIVRGHKSEASATKRTEPRVTRPRADAPPRSGIREAVVARAKRLLAQGYYENTYVLEFAVARLLDEAMSGRTVRVRARSAAPGRQAREAPGEQVQADLE